ncbi:TPA: hypothetical protein TVE81_001369 [Streptococcus equi subsp. zooepidemicus]|uniref:hypothetical protein n=1 Tax=Streptococcus equi TaxID=1336 RepID=UPI0013F61946|nr:hypothetical protein [Streptococcus equi]MCD3381667.1 hypothetical protein [Streptococcus equi subsp. zooepidemicus]MCD3406673.1 hypothetical protein [Streptococcus equi subsp. zooepidemicus]QUQ78117.1 hypothetical protein JDBNIEOD_01147 [Streptococcus equi subsp. zooepidemicus]HEK9985462.1 hypothetical protein [Streptococcus equi subsp. zooepidemicus]HEL0637901.1 hypothetical protein [Streptococcus equi subsp. zooepidemicus]
MAYKLYTKADVGDNMLLVAGRPLPDDTKRLKIQRETLDVLTITHYGSYDMVHLKSTVKKAYSKNTVVTPVSAAASKPKAKPKHVLNFANANKVYIGSTRVIAVYLGDRLIWSDKHSSGTKTVSVVGSLDIRQSQKMLYLYLIAPDVADVKSKRIKSIAINGVKLSSTAQISFEGSSYYYLVTIKQVANIKEIKNIASKNKITLEF